MKIGKGLRVKVKVDLAVVERGHASKSAVEYIHGGGTMLPGIEADARRAAKKGAKRDGVLKAKDALVILACTGEDDEADRIPQDAKLTAGDKFTAKGVAGGMDVVLQIEKVGEEEVDVKLVHALADKDIKYSVEVLQVSDPKPPPMPVAKALELEEDRARRPYRYTSPRSSARVHACAASLRASWRVCRASENTLEAFQRAAEIGVDALEMDVQVTWRDRPADRRARRHRAAHVGRAARVGRARSRGGADARRRRAGASSPPTAHGRSPGAASRCRCLPKCSRRSRKLGINVDIKGERSIRLMLETVKRADAEARVIARELSNR